jgi:hypothetical protein
MCRKGVIGKRARLRDAWEDAKTIIWNGPMGAFKMEAFARWTISLCSCCFRQICRDAATKNVTFQNNPSSWMVLRCKPNDTNI